MSEGLTLGVHVGHDAAAAAFSGARLLYAEEEERHSRVKSQGGCPWRAIDAAIAAGGRAGEVRTIALTWSLGPYFACRRALADHARAVGNEAWFEKRQRELAIVNDAVESLHRRFPAARIVDFPHHHAHLACAVHFAPRGSRRDGPVLGVVADALGDAESLTAFCAPDAEGLLGSPRVVLRRSPQQSLGFLYKRAAEAFGFAGSEAPGHLMSLSGCARRESAPVPLLRDALFTRDAEGLLDFREDGFDAYRGHSATADRCFPQPLRSRLGLEAPWPRERLPERAPQAQALQAIAEDYLEELLRHLVAAHRPSTIFVSGGVFLNCVALERLARALEGVSLIVCPVKKDSGTAIGAAVLAEAAEHGAAALCSGSRSLRLGTPVVGTEEAWAIAPGRFEAFESREALVRSLVDDLRRGEILALVDGPGEFGPRALGARSILADPSNRALTTRLNAQVKCRHPFQPFAGAFLAGPFRERHPGVAADESMSWAVRLADEGGLDGLLHRDGSCRVQLVPESDGSLLSALLKDLGSRGLPPVVLNTSLNPRGEPMPRTAADVRTTCAALGLSRIYTPAGRWTA